METERLVTEQENLDSKLVHKKGHVDSGSVPLLSKRGLGVRDGKSMQTPRRALNDVRNVSTPIHNTINKPKEKVRQAETKRQAVVEEEPVEFCPPPPNEPFDDGCDVIGPANSLLSSIPIKSWNNHLKFPIYRDPSLPTDDQIDAYFAEHDLIRDEDESVDYCSKQANDDSLTGGRLGSPPESPLPRCSMHNKRDTLSDKDIEDAIDLLFV